MAPVGRGGHIRKNNMTEVTALKKSIEHWKKMIAWAETRNIFKCPNMSEMIAAIGQTWRDEYCALCTKYTGADGGCTVCPLVPHCDDDKPSAWSRVAMATTWGEWIYHAYTMLAELSRLYAVAKHAQRVQRKAAGN